MASLDSPRTGESTQLTIKAAIIVKITRWTCGWECVSKKTISNVVHWVWRCSDPWVEPRLLRRGNRVKWRTKWCHQNWLRNVTKYLLFFHPSTRERASFVQMKSIILKVMCLHRLGTRERQSGRVGLPISDFYGHLRLVRTKCAQKTKLCDVGFLPCRWAYSIGVGLTMTVFLSGFYLCSVKVQGNASFYFRLFIHLSKTLVFSLCKTKDSRAINCFKRNYNHTLTSFLCHGRSNTAYSFVLIIY